jgi:hypothetical protein
MHGAWHREFKFHERCSIDLAFSCGMDQMLSVGNSVLGSAASLPPDSRIAASAALLAAGPTAAAGPRAVSTSQRVPAFNSIEFIYRQDYGKVVLLQQNADTGQEVTQIPSEYHLQQYAAGQRAQRQQQERQLFEGTPVAQAKARSVATGAAVGIAPGTAPAAVPATGEAAPAAAQPAAPVVAAAAPHLDIKV